MTPTQILEEIIKNGCEDVIFLELSSRLIGKKDCMQKKIAEHEATLRLIKKITKDKTVKSILEE